MNRPKARVAEAVDSFVGRESELTALRSAMRTARLVSLVGPGGVGKTRTALEILRRMSGGRRDLRLVELASVRDGHLLAETLATSLGVRDHTGEPVVSTIVKAINDQRLWLLLDNCEQIVSECAELVMELLGHCPELRVLATSREPLCVPGETLVRIDPLPVDVPDGCGGRERLLRTDAVRLFVDRARAVDAGFETTPDAVEAVAQLCRRLDGIPLAIELAARRVQTLPVREIGQLLGNQLNLLTGMRTASPRHRNLRATIEWSYRLLDPAEQAMLRTLSVCAGGFTLDAAAAVCTGGPVSPVSVLPLLLNLNSKSLVERTSAAGEPLRFRMLESIRQYAWEQLCAAGEEDAAASRLVAWLTTLSGPLVDNVGVTSTVTRTLDAERDNLVVALEFLRSRPSRGDERTLLTAALVRAWQLRGRVVAARRLLHQVLDEVPDSVYRPAALIALSWLTARQGSYDEALKQAVEAVRLARRQDLPGLLGRSLKQLASALFMLNRYATSECVYRQLLRLVSSLGDRKQIATCQQDLAWALLAAGSVDEARTLIEKALPVHEAELPSSELASPLHTSAAIAIRQGDFAAARRDLLEVVRVAPDDTYNWPYVLEGLAIVAERTGEPARAELLFAAAAASRERLELKADPVWQDQVDASTARLASALAIREALAARRRGRTKSDEELVRYAFGEDGDTRQAELLSPRELQLITLLADGLTNEQVARRLDVTKRTVGNYLDRVKQKLGLRTRAQLIRWHLDRSMQRSSTMDAG